MIVTLCDHRHMNHCYSIVKITSQTEVAKYGTLLVAMSRPW